jgi:hypothetical protein
MIAAITTAPAVATTATTLVLGFIELQRSPG